MQTNEQAGRRSQRTKKKKRTTGIRNRQTNRCCQTTRHPRPQTERQTGKQTDRHGRTKGTENDDRKGPENARTGNDRKTDRKRTGSKSPERTGIAFRARARKTGTGPEEAKEQDRKRTGMIVFSLDRPGARPCRRSAPKPFRAVPFSHKLSLVTVIRGPRGVLIRARRSKRGQALHGWFDRPVCWTNLSSGLDGI